MQVAKKVVTSSEAINDVSYVSLDKAQSFLADYNFDYVLYRLVTIEKWSKKSAKRVLEQYKNFLYLKKKYSDSEEIIPSLEIDEVWHAHILYTKQYAKFCQKFFGKFLHHIPQLPWEATKSDSKIDELFERTQELYKQEFGEYIYQVRKRNLFG